MKTRTLIANALNIVQLDANNIRNLTKLDMIEFFQHYISPSSALRAKLVIQLRVQGIPGGLSLVDDTHERIGTL